MVSSLNRRSANGIWGVPGIWEATTELLSSVDIGSIDPFKMTCFVFKPKSVIGVTFNPAKSNTGILYP